MRQLLILLLISLALPASADTVVTARNLRPGMIVTAQDVKLVATDLAGGFQLLEDVIGQEARVVLYTGRPVLPNDIGPPSVIDRNQIVTLVYTAGPMTILAEGRSLGSGAIGDRVRVMNLSSRTTITGSVSANGDVIVSNSHAQF
ncbi:flagella basal body P-ring formation protein FlgA [Aliiroseovarius halocynthiae]|uniref:Flagella basal body P-ring formation protein FlgA n=1 Tax=Aliiroseovarius halocynthiae TaxID=985055 RepID=A0A545SLP4_9RHOB|nr:flagellar basal body P-ring formation chaperone FlgA [Aliiroseovarius halocynthiae]TQV65895.1 flagellar basal body P-ring formation protein FlgA [Aliiroseovarius halocynthiae]SMR83474.1 flagella basal body P-ring formation protein FlgA [Aliiroseovarius halocynthiae]